MSMIGEYLRLSPDDYENAVTDPGWARELVDELFEADGEEDPDPRLIDVDKAWHGLALVLDHAGVATAVVFGDDVVPGADDWGYGPPSSLSPERVGELAAALRSLDPREAVEAVPAAAFTAAEIYPVGLWDDPASVEYLIGHLERLAAFFDEAANAKMGMLVWLD